MSAHPFTVKAGAVRNARGRFVKVADIRAAIDAQSARWINGGFNGFDSRNGSQLAVIRLGLAILQNFTCPVCASAIAPVEEWRDDALSPDMSSTVRLPGRHKFARVDGATYVSHTACIATVQRQAVSEGADYVAARLFAAPHVIPSERVTVKSFRTVAIRTDLTSAAADVANRLRTAGWAI